MDMFELPVGRVIKDHKNHRGDQSMVVNYLCAGL